MINISQNRVATAAALALVAASSLTACQSESSSQQAIDSPRYEATVTRTPHGVAHITAASWGALGFGEAYAAAEDQVCNMALALLQSRGESATVFGPGHEQRNLTRDITVKALGIPERAGAALQAQTPDIREWIEGYAAGYNQYLAEHPEGVGSWCDQAEWVRPVSAEAFMAQYLTLVQTLPRASGAIAAAGLPEPAAGAPSLSAADAPAVKAPESRSVEAMPVPKLASTLSDLTLRGMGSNAWALGDGRTEGANSLLLANPHYPWYGIARFWEKHLTIPGVYDAYGVSLIGTPGVSLGFNAHVGWSHTVSNSKRTVIYQLTLDPSDPTRYRWGDDWRTLDSTAVEIGVKAEDGIALKQHTVWFSHHGPLIALPGVIDDPYTVFAVRDANAENLHVLGQWQAMGQAKGMDEFINAHRRFNAMPWINTIAVSREGRAAYIDNSTVGALSSEAIADWRARLSSDPRQQFLYLDQGLVILDGSRLDQDWRETSSPVPQTEPFEQRPLIESRDYVFNANDSYWLSDPANPAEALSPLYGPTHSPRTVRTRMNVELLRPDSPLGYAGEDALFSMVEVQTALFGNDSLTAHLLLPELLAACADESQREFVTGTVDLEAACDVLANWDRRFNVDSRGAVLFREWLTRYPYNETYLGRELFAVPFNPAKPLTTPLGLKDPGIALDKLAEAVALMTGAGIPLDTELGTHQRGHRMREVIPVHGGNRREGIANLQVSATRYSNPTETPIYTGSDVFVTDSESLSETGYNVVHGSSFIMTLAYTDEGPEAQAILSYSQSGDPDSEYFSDQTALYRDKMWRDILFEPTDIAREAISVTTLKSGSSETSP
jgi:acyl-homoserine-lactone acylase